MAQDKTSVESQIKALGNFSRDFVRKEIRFLPEILRANEHIHAMTSGRFKDHANWLVVVTEQRILCLYKGIFFGMKQIELPMQKISAIGHQTGLIFGEITVITSGGSEALTMIPKADVVLVANALSELVNAQAQGILVERKVSNGSVASTSSAPVLQVVPRSSDNKVPRKLAKMQAVALIVFLFAMITWLFHSIFDKGRPSTQKGAQVATTAVQSEGPLSITEKDYLSLLLDYQRKQNDIGMTVGKAMIGVNTGESTLKDIHKAIKNAAIENEVAFQMYYDKQVEVPSSFAGADKLIRKSYDLRMAAYKEYLKYWDDANVSHIPKAEKIFVESETIAQAASKEATQILNRIENKRKGK